MPISIVLRLIPINFETFKPSSAQTTSTGTQQSRANSKLSVEKSNVLIFRPKKRNLMVQRLFLGVKDGSSA